MQNEKFKFNNVVFFISNEKIENEKVGQVTIKDEHYIIKVPSYLSKGLKIGVRYSIECTKMQKGRGFILNKYAFYVPKTEIKLSSDKTSVVVIHNEKTTPYCYDVSGTLTPAQFYTSKKYYFNESIKEPGALQKWKAALQEISQQWELGDWDDFNIDAKIKPLEELETEPSFEPNWNIDGIDEIYEK